MAKKMGRPPKEIDKEQFEKLCGLQCSIIEVCDYFDVTDKTLNSWCKRTYDKTYSEVFEEKRSSGKISLRRAQYQLALKGNATMLIWLGRNWLGQTDKDKSDGMDEVLKRLDAMIAALGVTAETPIEVVKNEDESETG